MGMISFMKPGDWWTKSKSDLRWNMSGQGIVGGGTLPEEARKAIEEKEKELGEKRPKDLTFSYMKD